MSFDKRAYWEGVLGDGTRPPATDFVGFDLIAFDVDAGWAEAAFTLPDEAKNPAGNAQGGFITAALDEIMSVAGSIVQDGPAMAPTLQMTVSFIRPVPVGTRLIGRGEVLRKGRAAIFTQGTLSLEDGTLLAQATASCIPRSLA
ncbi:MAG: PaaI family thioesterase [Hyphomonas sp.]|uniref:PaaI family thioesterase n=1 Tax=Hyphomonas sp. TaxID=87 RepID=UPI00352894C7